MALLMQKNAVVAKATSRSRTVAVKAYSGKYAEELIATAVSVRSRLLLATKRPQGLRHCNKIAGAAGRRNAVGRAACSLTMLHWCILANGAIHAALRRRAFVEGSPLPAGPAPQSAGQGRLHRPWYPGHG